MRPLRLTVEYDGTDFSGWQVQPGARTVQGVLERALEQLCGAPVKVTAAGRTDAGVHATGQVVSLLAPARLPLRALSQGLTALLPADVAIADAEEAPAGFDARRWASGKTYVYRLWNGPQRSPVRRRSHTLVFAPLNVAAMADAAARLPGRQDFTSFRASNCPAAHAVRDLRQLTVEGATRGEIVVTAEATAFLKHMVRNLVGTLLDVGHGKRRPDSMAALLAAKDRTQAGPTAPPQGLTLAHVAYDDPARFVLPAARADEPDDDE